MIYPTDESAADQNPFVKLWERSEVVFPRATFQPSKAYSEARCTSRWRVFLTQLLVWVRVVAVKRLITQAQCLAHLL